MGKPASKAVKSPAARLGPQTRDDVVEAIAAIGRHQRDRDRIQAAMNDELAEIRQKYEAQALPHAEEIAELSRGVQTWCDANRLAITDGGKVKSASLASGEVRWRLTPPACSIKQADKVMERLRDLDLTQFIRTKEEIDKAAILADSEAVAGIKGITITRREEFVIVPFETALEQVA